jgi:hypothetical protein
MDTAFRAFHEDLIDYAGLFPPAELELAAALANYRTYVASDESWMLARFVCPIPKLEKVSRLCEAADAPPPRRLTVLARPAETYEQLMQVFDEDLAALQSYRGKQGERSVAEALELRLPPKLAEPAPVLAELRDRIRERLSGRLQVFVEATPERKMPDVVTRTLEGIGAVREGAHGDAWEDVGFKLRCGGVIAAAYPELDTVKTVLGEAHRLAVPTKATAGLHHPVRHHREDLGVDEHGFWNVFGAGVLFSAGVLQPERLEEILAETDPTRFAFSDGRFSWADLSADAEAVRRGRAQLVTSFGSCSFDEPREDLSELGFDLFEE